MGASACVFETVDQVEEGSLFINGEGQLQLHSAIRGHGHGEEPRRLLQQS